jgi:hypothetical protein
LASLHSTNSEENGLFEGKDEGRVGHWEKEMMDGIVVLDRRAQLRALPDVSYFGMAPAYSTRGRNVFAFFIVMPVKTLVIVVACCWSFLLFCFLNLYRMWS